MEGEISTLKSSNESKKSFDTISILVVDDDTTCLSIVAALLKRFKYEVVTVKHPNDALCTLRIKGGAFDLVISDVHMPDMNGFELQKAISQEFNLPVVLMSADDKEGNVLKGLENGATFFIVKPVCADDLRDLWQFAAMKKKQSPVVIEETGSFPIDKTSTGINNSDVRITVSASSVNEDRPNNKDSKRKLPKKEGSDEKNEKYEAPSQKRPKVIWNNSLHNRFLEAIRSIGLDRAVPKKILEVMNVPGLTRENVASHLQKYRIFLRRVSNASLDIQSSTLFPNVFTKFQYQNPRQFPSQEPSTSSLATLSGFGQSRLVSNKVGFPKPNIGNTYLINENPRPDVGFTHNNYPNPNPHPLNPDPNSPNPNPLNPNPNPNPVINYEVSSYINIGSNINPNPNPSIPSNDFTHQTNYVGYSISNIKHLLEKSCGGTINLPSKEHENTRVNHAALLANENINLDQLTQNVGASTSFVPDSNGGDQLYNVNTNYQTLLPSNLPMISGLENGGEIKECGFSQMFDLPGTFDIMSNPQPLEEADFNPTFGDQVIDIQNQGEEIGVLELITSSGFFGGTSHWDNNVPFFDQATNQHDCQGLIDSQEFGSSSQLNNTILLPSNEQQSSIGFTNSLQFGSTSQKINRTPQSPSESQHDDDDFLESLLVPFEDDENLEWI